MSDFFRNVLTASFHGSIVILAVLALRLVLRRAPKKYVCFLWVLAGLRLLMPFELQSSLSLQPEPHQHPQKTNILLRRPPQHQPQRQHRQDHNAAMKAGSQNIAK